MLDLIVATTSPTAKMPVKSGNLEAGIDFFADLHAFGEKTIIYPNARKTISLGVAMAIPSGWFLRLAGRSGLARDKGIMVLGGIIDCTYRGEIAALLYNSGDHPWTVNHGDKVLQGVILPVPEVEFRQVKSISDLPASDRGEKGFGSSGA